MTLIELLVVLSIAAILVVVLGFQYSGWQGKYKVESQVKQLYSDLVGARTLAMQNGFDYFADFPSSSQYRISQDDSNGTANVTGGNGKFEPQTGATQASNTDTTLATYPKTVSYTINWSNAANPSDIALTNAAIAFDRKGMITYLDKTTGAVDNPSPVMISFTSTVSTDYDCIVLNQTMIAMGKKVCSNNAAISCNSDSDCSGGTCSTCQEK